MLAAFEDAVAAAGRGALSARIADPAIARLADLRSAPDALERHQIADIILAAFIRALAIIVARALCREADRLDAAPAILARRPIAGGAPGEAAPSLAALDPIAGDAIIAVKVSLA